MFKLRICTGVFLAALMVLGASSAAQADTIVIDQFNNVTPNYGRNIAFFVIGQEFRPEVRALDFVDLYMDDSSCGLVYDPGGYALVRIRAGSITGPVIGTSNASHFPNCFYGILRFVFPAVVRMKPHEVYVIEAVYVSGDTSGAYSYDGASTYANGRAIIDGVPQEDKDLWFQEGIAYSIPDSRDDCTLGRWRGKVKHDGTWIRSEKGCKAYVAANK